MNTIPSTFNERQINRTVIGGKEKCPNILMNVAVVILNTEWSYFRGTMLENLAKTGFAEIISVESAANNYNIEDFSQRYPFVKFIIPLEPVTDGDLVNISMAEVQTEYVLVIRDTLNFSSDLLTPRLASNLTENKPYCVSPRLLLQQNTSFPIIFSPSVNKFVFTVDGTAVVSDGVPNLYPYDYIGLYNRKKFIDLGGFDYTITSSYWQNLDLSFRAWLWGERITFSTAFVLSYGTEIRPEDTKANQSSNRFYLKNLAPKYVRDHGYLSYSSFWIFLLRSSCGLFEAMNQFKAARAWVDKNKYRYKLDAIDLVQNWYKLQTKNDSKQKTNLVTEKGV